MGNFYNDSYHHLKGSVAKAFIKQDKEELLKRRKVFIILGTLLRFFFFYNIDYTTTYLCISIFLIKIYSSFHCIRQNKKNVPVLLLIICFRNLIKRFIPDINWRHCPVAVATFSEAINILCGLLFISRTVITLSLHLTGGGRAVRDGANNLQQYLIWRKLRTSDRSAAIKGDHRFVFWTGIPQRNHLIS